MDVNEIDWPTTAESRRWRVPLLLPERTLVQAPQVPRVAPYATAVLSRATARGVIAVEENEQRLHSRRHAARHAVVHALLNDARTRINPGFGAISASSSSVPHRGESNARP